MTLPSFVKIVEVGPRDGLQNESQFVPTDIKIDFINQLSETGLSVIEATSFVSAKWIPQLADNREVFSRIIKKPGVSYPVLVPNVKGFEDALSVGATEIAVFTTPSETFSQKNTNCSVKESLRRLDEVIRLALEAKVKVRAYISCVAGCPYEGEISPASVRDLAVRLVEKGCYEISLGDTIGVGTPLKISRLLETVLTSLDVSQTAVHFHNTFGQALVNIYAALQMGIHIVDSSTAGLGGCPYAKGAAGNVATEDVVYLLNGLNIKTNVNLEKIVHAGKFITKFLNKPPQSNVNLAFKDSIDKKVT